MNAPIPYGEANLLALQKAKREAGGAKALAKLLGGITPQAIYQWQQIPVARVLDVARATGIPKWELRPDIYSPPDEAAE